MRALISIPALSLLFTVAAQEPAAPTAPAAPCCDAKAKGDCCADMAAQDPAKKTKLDEKLYDHFGDGIVEGPATELAEVMKAPDQFTGKTLRLSGPVTAVCQTKGCWMYLGKPDANGTPPVMVKFKDYAFFVPKDASGRTAVIEGTMTMKQETVEQTKHYLEDAGKTEEAAKVTEGRKLYLFMASGVAIAKPAEQPAEKPAK